MNAWLRAANGIRHALRCTDRIITNVDELTDEANLNNLKEALPYERHSFARADLRLRFHADG
jgi:dTDP-D-glucose 4,6-dehydratase